MTNLPRQVASLHDLARHRLPLRNPAEWLLQSIEKFNLVACNHEERIERRNYIRSMLHHHSTCNKPTQARTHMSRNGLAP